MTECQAVAKRAAKLMREKGFSQYRLEKEGGLDHGTLNGVFKGNKGIEFKTILKIIRGLHLTVAEFFDDPVFSDVELDFDR